MSDEMVMPSNLLHTLENAKKEGFTEGYSQALFDLQREINGIPYTYNTISVELVNGIIEKLRNK